MLPESYKWLIHEDVALLRYNSGGVAVVRLQPNGKWRTCISWQHREHEAIAGSQAQGIMWVTRWVAARDGPPGPWPERKTFHNPFKAASGIARPR